MGGETRSLAAAKVLVHAEAAQGNRLDRLPLGQPPNQLESGVVGKADVADQKIKRAFLGRFQAEPTELAIRT